MIYTFRNAMGKSIFNFLHFAVTLTFMALTAIKNTSVNNRHKAYYYKQVKHVRENNVPTLFIKQHKGNKTVKITAQIISPESTVVKQQEWDPCCQPE